MGRMRGRPKWRRLDVIESDTKRSGVEDAGDRSRVKVEDYGGRPQIVE